MGALAVQFSVWPGPGTSAHTWRTGTLWCSASNLFPPPGSHCRGARRMGLSGAGRRFSTATTAAVRLRKLQVCFDLHRSCAILSLVVVPSSTLHPSHRAHFTIPHDSITCHDPHTPHSSAPHCFRLRPSPEAPWGRERSPGRRSRRRGRNRRLVQARLPTGARKSVGGSIWTKSHYSIRVLACLAVNP